ncbi:MAG: PqqD family protein [Thermoguttaceae bacterium]|nr:PqqD family protein [Thermoguttaceae bacterium]MBQ7110839.1 PqqD family protein [Thermoguttaceae bacterium]
MKLNPNVVFRQDEPGVGVLYVPQTCALNGAGIALWKALESGADRAGLVAALKATFAVCPDDATLERDVDAFLNELLQKGFLLEEANGV